MASYDCTLVLKKKEWNAIGHFREQCNHSYCDVKGRKGTHMSIIDRLEAVFDSRVCISMFQMHKP